MLKSVVESLAALQQEVNTSRRENQVLYREVGILRKEVSGLAHKGPGGVSYIKPATLPPPVSTAHTPLLGAEGGGFFVTSPTTPPLSDPVPTVHVIQSTGIPLAPPERFYGDPRKFETFLNQCRLHFLCKPGVFQDDSAKTAFMMSYMGGNAANWTIPLLERNDPVLHSFFDFCLELRKLFDRKSHMLSLDRELLTLRQGSQDLLSYITSFNRLVVETEWPPAKRISIFYQGLRGELKDVLAQVVQLPNTCEDLIDLTVQLDHRLLERRGDRNRGEGRYFYPRVKSSTEDHPKVPEGVEPMQIGGIRRPLYLEEKEKRRRLKQCLYCGKGGHFIKDCRARNALPGRPMVPRSQAIVQSGSPAEN